MTPTFFICISDTSNSLSALYGGPQLSRQNQFHHGKIILLTAKLFCSWQNQFHHGKINFIHGKINFITAKSFCSWQNQFHHGKIILLTAKSISLTFARYCGSQSYMAEVSRGLIKVTGPHESYVRDISTLAVLC